MKNQINCTQIPARKNNCWQFAEMNVTLLIILGFVVFSIAPVTASELNSNLVPDKLIYLVRHAEKQELDAEDANSKDVDLLGPSLTQQGEARALQLAELLKGAGITQIFSTNYHRTLQTAQPLAKQLSIEIQDYDPAQLEVFAQQILSLAGNILIVGHSNTTPQLAQLIDGESLLTIDESEYDYLFKLQVSQGKIKRYVEHYGVTSAQHVLESESPVEKK